VPLAKRSFSASSKARFCCDGHEKKIRDFCAISVCPFDGVEPELVFLLQSGVFIKDSYVILVSFLVTDGRQHALEMARGTV
jgi:hypothetical protein